MNLLKRLDAKRAEERRLREMRERHNVSTPLKAGDRIRRIKDGRVFKLAVINFGGVNGGVFSATSDDGEWGDWGGPISNLVYGETFESA